MLAKKICPVTKRAIEVVLQEPLLQTFLVEDMGTSEFMDLLRAQDRIEADDTSENESGFRKEAKKKTKETKTDIQGR